MDHLLPGGPVEGCLDSLFDHLAGTGADGRRSLAEAEDHLREAVTEGLARGLDRETAERAAVERFGAPESIAAGLRATADGAWGSIRPFVAGGARIGIAAALALGVSGLISEVTGRLFSPRFVAGDAPGVTYTASRCAEYLRLVSQPMTCAQGAAYDHWGEVAMGRELAGVLGLLALGAYALLRRRSWRGSAWRTPAGLVPLVTAVLAGFVAIAFLGSSALDAMTNMTSGIGTPLADGTAAALLAIGAAALAVRQRRYRTA